jgi:hypothetical protein
VSDLSPITSRDWACHEALAATYQQDCREVAADENLLRHWRTRHSLRYIIDHVDRAFGRTCFDMALWLDATRTMEILPRVAELDLVLDRPDAIEVGGLRLSPTMCRYLVRAIELNHLFDLEGQRIVEIGGGFGGLAAVLHTLVRPASYVIYDLPDVQAAQRAALGLMGLPGVQFETDVATMDGDLLVSDYAFSELHDDVQERYGARFSRFPHGALLCSSHLFESRLNCPRDMVARLARLSGVAVECGFQSDHYRDLWWHFGDPRAQIAYLWRRA